MVDAKIIPRVRVGVKSIHSPISRCGDNWWKDVRIRCPYNGIDIAFRKLPSLGDPNQIDELDLDFLDEMRADHKRISFFVVNHIAHINVAQRDKIDVMLARAGAYIDAVSNIWNVWSNGFITSSNGLVPAWPLNGTPEGQVNVNIEVGHQRDIDRCKLLVRGALLNLRCSEEVAKKATIRTRNKEYYERGLIAR